MNQTIYTIGSKLQSPFWGSTTLAFPMAGRWNAITKIAIKALGFVGMLLTSPLALIGALLKKIGAPSQEMRERGEAFFSHIAQDIKPIPYRGRLSTMTYNITGFPGALPTVLDRYAPFSQRALPISTILKRENHPVVCLQELSEPSARKLIPLMAGHYRYIYYNGGAPVLDMDSGCCILSKIKPQKVSFHPFKEQPQKGILKGFFKLEFTDWTYFGTHLSPHEPAMQKSREKQLEEIRAHFDTTKRIILAGDLNTPPGLLPSLNPLRFSVPLDKTTCEEPTGRVRLDYILTRGFNALSSRVLSLNPRLSDHDPVSANF